MFLFSKRNRIIKKAIAKTVSAFFDMFNKEKNKQHLMGVVDLSVDLSDYSTLFFGCQL